MLAEDHFIVLDSMMNTREGTLIMDPQEKAGIFADYYSTLYTLDTPDREAIVNFYKICYPSEC